MTKSSHPRGTTLFSLLLILAVLGMLSAMLFPALLRVRLMAQQMRCGNNLNQFGIGVHNYITASANSEFPTSGTDKPDHKKAGTGSWSFQLLPYLEQQKLFEANGGDTAVAVFYSPTRRTAELFDKLPKTDYAGSTGAGADPLKPDDDGVFTAKGLPLNTLLNADGSSNVLMISVKSLNSKEYLTGKGKGDTGSCWNGGTIDTLRSGKDDPMHDAADKDFEKSFGCPAALKNLNVLMCDGAVRRWKIGKTGFGTLASYNDKLTPDFD